MDDLINNVEFYLLVRNKDVLACSQLYHHFSPVIYGQIFTSVKDHEVAEDLTQETFIKVYQKFDQFDPLKGRLYTWIISIARNNCMDYHRKTKYTFREVAETDSVYSADSIYNAIENKRLGYWFSKFNPHMQLLLELVFIRGYTHEQAAVACCIPLGTVKTRLKSAIKKLSDEVVAKPG